MMFRQTENLWRQRADTESMEWNMWICIHDTIDGPKLRGLHKKIGCSKFEAVGILVCLWLWGVQNADEEGHLVNADRGDMERFLHGESSGFLFDEGVVYDALIDTGWIDDVDGELYLHDWQIWQKACFRYSSRLKKDAERKRKTYSGKEDTKEKGDCAEEKEAKNEAPKEDVPAEKPKKQTGKDYPEEFVKLWEVYPRKDRKAEAYESFCARLKDGTDPEDMKKAAEAYAMKCRKEKTPQRYIMQGKTFFGTHLNFLDYVPQKKEPEDVDANPFDSYVGGR